MRYGVEPYSDKARDELDPLPEGQGRAVRLGQSRDEEEDHNIGKSGMKNQFSIVNHARPSMLAMPLSAAR